MCKHIVTKMIPLDTITVAERIRKDNGDLQQLADDIQKRGLINPITVMEQDEGYLLIAGFRRMEATRLLGADSVLASVVSAVEADEQLMLEISENEQRKEFTRKEKLIYADRIKAIELEKGRQRMAIFARKGREDEFAEDGEARKPRDIANKGNEGTHERAYPDKGESRKMIAQKAGFSSYGEMERTAYLAGKRPELLEEVEAGDRSLYDAYKEARGLKKPQNDHCRKETTQADAPRIEKPIEKQTIKEIQSRIVTAVPVERETVVMFNPMTIPVNGPKTSLKGADHEHLLDNPVYSALYDEYAKAVQTANGVLGRIFSTSEGCEKRIRGYEENIQAMHRTTEGLRVENEKLRAEIGRLRTRLENNQTEDAHNA